MSEKLILEEVSAENVRNYVEHIVTEIPSRLAGSENGKRMAEYSRDALNKVGIEGRVYEFPGLVSFPKHADLQITSPTEFTIEANTLGHSLQTPDTGISGELVYIGSGTYEDYEGKDVNGKITLTELSYAPARHEKQRITAEKGGIGTIMMNWGHPENTAVPFGSVKPCWGNPTPETNITEMPTIPCIGIARSAGLQLKEMTETQPVQVKFHTHVENTWKPVQITVGEIKGQTDDFMLVGGHQDSWYGEASTDNAAGNACMIELARVFNKYAGELRRGLVFGFWTGHETGTMIGSSWYVDKNWDRLRSNAVAYLQIDQPACAGTSEWMTHSNSELKPFHQRIEKRFLNDRKINWHRTIKFGDASLFGLGVPQMHGESSFTEQKLKETAMAVLGWWHHSLECTLDKLDWNWMADHLRIYAAYLWEICTAPVLPFQFSETAQQFETRLQELVTIDNSIGLDEAVHCAQQFRIAADTFDTTSAEWRQRYNNGEINNDEPAELLNTCMKKLSRILVPLQSTVIGTYGHDRYGMTDQRTMIPVLFEIGKLATLAKDSEAYWMLQTKLVRQRNKVVDGLIDSQNLINRTLSDLK